MNLFRRKRNPRRSVAEMYRDLAPSLECDNPKHIVYNWSWELKDYVCVDCGRRMSQAVKQRYEDAGNDLFDF